MIQVIFLSIILLVFCIYDDIVNEIAIRLHFDVDDEVKK